jgi:Tol biopolymer transport system component
MNPRDDLDRMLEAWLDEPYAAPTSRILGRVLERTQRTRQRRAWANLERWLPMSVITRPALAPPLRVAPLLLLVPVILALVAGGAILGPRLLTPYAAADGSNGTAAIPQGDDAIFAFRAYEGGDIFTVRADGTDLRQLTDDGAVTSEPIWSPDGTRMAFNLRQDGLDSLVVMDAGGGERTTLATYDPPQGDCDSWSTWSLTWSPDGTTLIFPTAEGCSFDLSIVAADGSAPAAKLLAPGLNSVHAAWSPDGTKLAYLASEPSGSTGLYVADTTALEALSGGIQGELLSPDLGPDLGTWSFGDEFDQPQWSPDGTELAVAAVPHGFFLVDAEGIYIVQSDGSGQRLLTERAGNAAWSPDGQLIAFQRTVDPSEYVNSRPCTVRTWIIDADGSDERELAELGDGCDAPPRWSPDGTRLASVLIEQTPDDPEMSGASDSSVGVPFHLGFVMVDGSSPPVLLQDAIGSWQPVAAPLP